MMQDSQIHWARDVAETLECSWEEIQKTVNKVIRILMDCDIPYYKEIDSQEREIDGKMLKDLKMSPLAAQLVAVNAKENPTTSALQVHLVQLSLGQQSS